MKYKFKQILYNLAVNYLKKYYFTNKLFDFLEDHKVKLFGHNNLLNYPIDHIQINSQDLLKYLKTINIPNNYLIICDPQNYHYLISHFKNVFSISNIDEIEESDYSGIVWLSQIPPLGSSLVIKFYRNKKEVLSYEAYGPIRITSYGYKIYSTLLEEQLSQSKDGFEKFSYGTGYDQAYLLQLIDNVLNLEGDILEIGCFRGSTSCVLVNYFNKLGVSKKLYFLDTFEGFNYEQAKNSIDKKWYGTHESEGYEVIKKRILSRNTEGNNVQVIKSNIFDENSLNFTDSISLVSIDVDMYEAVYESLLKVENKIVKNGIIVCEDYGHLPALIGANAAVDEFLSKTKTKFFKLYLNSGQLLLIKLEN